MQKSLLTLIICLFSFGSFAQNADSTWFVNNYTKQEKYITMRDGIRLFTSFYIPKDNSEKHPFLLTRTPYSCAPYGEDKFAPWWYSFRFAYAKENYGWLHDVQLLKGQFQLGINYPF